MKNVLVLVSVSATALASCALADCANASWPYGPFTTAGRHIINNKNESITFAGVNWPLSGETMIPEGLEYQSADELVSLIKSAGFNMLRMGYAIEMVDDIYERNGTDVSLEVALINAMGYENGTRVANEMIAKNPTWTLQTTRFEIWSDVVRVAHEHGILVHPDNHVSKAMWCCSNIDGNAWFDSFNFPVDKWLRGLAYIAEWAKKHPNIVSMSIRNELRPSWNYTEMSGTGLLYNWETYIGNMTLAADTIFAANPDLLITWSGMQYDEDLRGVINSPNLLTEPCLYCDDIIDSYVRPPLVFDLGEHAWADKIVWEMHMYDGLSETVLTQNCSITLADMYRRGFNALGIQAPAACDIIGGCQTANRLTPIILSEFGQNQDATLFTNTFMNCMKNWTIDNDISWMMWAFPGSYRVREGSQFVADTWSLSNFNFTGWNYPEGVEKFWTPWVKGMNVYTI